MKGTTKKRLLRLLRLTTVLILLIAMLTACGGKDDEKPNDDEETEGYENVEPEDKETEDEPTDPPATTAPEETTVMATVDTDLLNVRTQPSTDAPIAGQLTRDAQVEILEQTTVDGADWARTEVGWVQVQYLKIEGVEPTPEETPDTPADTKPEDDKTASDSKDDSSSSTTGTKGTVTASSLYIRKGAGTKYDTVGKYSKGDVITILETKNNWGRTDKGWVSLKYVSLDGKAPTTTDKDDKKDDTTSSTLVTDGKSKVLGTVEVDVGALNVRYGPGTKYDTCGKVYDGEKYDYYQEKYGWVRIKSGWISLAYTDQGSSDDKDDKDDAKIEVTDGKTTVLGYAVVKSGLNVRTGPGTSYDDIDTVSTGERVAYYQKDGTWIRTKEGWISAKYCYIEGDKGENACSGTVTGDNVNIRTGPGTGYTSTAKVNKGDKVTILETIKVGSTTWGYTGSGWISMDYVEKA